MNLGTASLAPESHPGAPKATLQKAIGVCTPKLTILGEAIQRPSEMHLQHSNP